MSPHLRSILMVLSTMVIWGSTFVVTKSVVAQVPPFTLAFARVAIGTAVLLLYAAMRPRLHGSGQSMRGLPWRTIAVMGLIGVALYYTAFNFALVYTSASQGALVQSCIPAVTALIALLWLREQATAGRWIGIALSVAGVLIVFAGSRENGATTPMLGNLLMFATTICWGVYTALARRIAGTDPVMLTAGIIGLGALMLLPATVLELASGGLPRIGVSEWLGIFYLGAIASGAAYLLYNAALRHLDATQAGVYTNLIPIVGVLSGVVLLGEPLSGRAILGGCVVLAGVWLTSRRADVQLQEAKS